jgi:uncharacterized membrane protein YidH (DUF202 family)
VALRLQKLDEDLSPYRRTYVMKIIGIVLIVVGIVALAFGGFRWTDRDKVVDIGPVEVTTEEHESLPISPIAGGVMLAAGAALLVAGTRRRTA